MVGSMEEFMQSLWDLPRNEAKEAYAKTPKKSLTEQLLYAILAQLDRISYQLELKD
jgi:hypothetical protein